MIGYQVSIRPDVIAWSAQFRPPPPPVPLRIPLDFIVAHVAAAHGLTLDAMLSQRRTQAIVKVRQFAMYLCRTLGGGSSAQTAAICRCKEHTTVLYAERSVKARLEADAAFKGWAEDLRSAIEDSHEAFRAAKLPASFPSVP